MSALGPSRDLGPHEKKFTVLNQGMIRQKYVKLMGETRSIHFLWRTETREPYRINRIWCMVTLKISEIGSLSFKWIDLARYWVYCRTP